MFSKKSIVLNGVNDKNKRAVLTLECDGEITKGNLRLYNFSGDLRGIISLGIYSQGQVIKAGLTQNAGMVFSFICQLRSIPQKFSCAVVNFLDGEPKPILYGNSEGYSDKEELFTEVISSLSQTNTANEVENLLDGYGIDFEDNLKEEINQNIENCMNEKCDMCQNCQYKNFYIQSQTEDKTAVIQSDNFDSEEKFYKELKSQIDILFENNPTEEYLQELIPNSKWVKVLLKDSEDYYVLGLIYEEDKLLYICYGVPGVYQKTAPRELSGFPIWFPLEENKPQGFGYWLSYQDANTGESVKAIVV